MDTWTARMTAMVEARCGDAGDAVDRARLVSRFVAAADRGDVSLGVWGHHDTAAAELGRRCGQGRRLLRAYAYLLGRAARG